VDVATSQPELLAKLVDALLIEEGREFFLNKGLRIPPEFKRL
jgi:hypothetical protein